MAEKGDFIEVQEYNARLWVNLTDYLDTGLFLDHRIARRMLGQMSKGKDFLNLFSIPAAPASTQASAVRDPPPRWICHAPTWSGRNATCVSMA